MPRIAVTFSLQEVEEIEKECAVYRGRLERIAKHSATSREKQVLRHNYIAFTCNRIYLNHIYQEKSIFVLFAANIGSQHKLKRVLAGGF